MRRFAIPGRVRRLLIGCLGILAAGLTAVAEPRVVGRVLDRVICGADESQSYALYVPSNYTSQKKWPVIFCFDASALGAVPVERLRPAAEKYGYIIAGSLNSRNGPWVANSVAIRAMFKDVGKHFALDPQRIYTAGVSGGARVATEIAVSGVAQGVIACSAGFPEPASIPDRVPFLFFGTVGTEDFNSAEMRRLDDQLDRREAVHRMVVFNGGHEWPSVELMTQAVEWLKLQTIRAGLEPADEKFVEATFRSRKEALPAGPELARWRSLRSLAADFKGLVDTRELERAAKELGKSQALKKELKEERVLMEREEELSDDIADHATGSAVRKQKFAAELRGKADRLEDSPERQMVRRVIAGYIAMTRERLSDWLKQEEYDRATGLLEMAELLRPRQARTLFDLARAYAFRGMKNRALDVLDQAAAAGFHDAAMAETDPAFGKLRDDPRFKEILAKILANMPRPEGPMVSQRGRSLFPPELGIFKARTTAGSLWLQKRRNWSAGDLAGE